MPRALHTLWRLRLALLLLAVAALYAAALYAAALHERPYLWGDNVHYLIVAKAVATGEGLRDVHLPGAPRFTYPIPLFPVVLAPIVALFDYALGPPRLLVALTGVVAVALAHRLFRQRVDARTAFVLAALVAVSPQVVSFSHQVMTEVPYLALSLGVLLLVRRYDAAAGWRSGAGVATALLLAAALLTRTIAVALLAAAAAYLVLDGRGPLRTRLAKATLLGAGAVAVWVAVNLPILAELTYLRELREGTASAGAADAPSLAERVAANVRGYAVTLPETVYYGLYERPAAWLAALVLLLVAAGLAVALRRRTPAEYYVAAYGAVLLVYEPSNLGNTQRYLVPLVPFALLYAALGARAAAGLVVAAARRARGAPVRWLQPRPLVLAGLAALLALNLLDTLQASVWRQEPEMFEYDRLGDVRGLERMAGWARAHTAPESVVATGSLYLFHYWSRRPVVWLPAPVEQPGAACALGVDYVALDSMPGRPTPDDRRLAAALDAAPGCAMLVYADGGNRLYRVRRGAAPGADSLPVAVRP